MSDVSYQLGEFIKAEKTVVGKNNTPAINVHYKRLDGMQAGKEMSVRYLAGKLDADSTDVLKALKTGDKFTVVKKKEGEYWNLDSFKAEDAHASRPRSAPPQSSGGGYTKTEKDQTGVKVGAARNQAIAYLAATRGVQFGLDDIDDIAYEIVKRQQVQEDHVRAGTSPEPTKATEEHFTGQDQEDDTFDF